MFQPLMAVLHRERLQERVFLSTHTGLDVLVVLVPLGEVYAQDSEEIVLGLPCLTTTEVHIQVVPSLEAATCVTAMSRFIARRGNSYYVSER